MLEKILEYERDVFFMLNGSDSAFLDRFMWLYSGKAVWLPLAAFIVITLIYKKNWKEWLLIFLAITLVVTLCDQFASHLLKPLFTRFRPTHHPDFMNDVKTVFDYRGGLYGFISSHAANSFGFAMYMALLFQNRFFTWTVFIWATLTAYTRIYLGVHFISDIVPGLIVGLIFGSLVYFIYVQCRTLIWKNRGGEFVLSSKIYSPQRIKLIVYAIIINIILLMIFNVQLASLLHN
ncbi:phosphatase PAP2 family protein [Parabacteroides sp. PF5-9]|uniref:phosphatase PAP2 family protein n=1 Tax=Parabacteroides sp. PF5-9 TaxID=1742404 RepID=UPI00247448DE|nr:phosphatase PAP2 family protein [Parabacteroides sp. PF5-9]MDH6358286.1 undecaprenyl-diphosphatase [Parabacteroides sp. PF5-9]